MLVSFIGVDNREKTVIDFIVGTLGLGTWLLIPGYLLTGNFACLIIVVQSTGLANTATALVIIT